MPWRTPSTAALPWPWEWITSRWRRSGFTRVLYTGPWRGHDASGASRASRTRAMAARRAMRAEAGWNRDTLILR